MNAITVQALLQSLKSTESDNNFILAHSRGGLVAPSHHLMCIVEKAEICFRQNVGEDELVLRNIPTEIICESTLSSSVVKSHCAGIRDRGSIKLYPEVVLGKYCQVVYTGSLIFVCKGLY